MKWLTPFLEESPGVKSSVRLQMIAAFFFAGILPILLWIVLSAVKGELLEFPNSVAAFCGGIIAAATGAKVVQYWKEPANQVDVQQ